MPFNWRDNVVLLAVAVFLLLVELVPVVEKEFRALVDTESGQS